MSATELPQGLADLVARWLKEEQDEDDVVVVLALATYGTDWAGDTESGFHSEADTEVRWRKADGSIGYRHLVGQDLADLWDWIVRGWPSG